MDLKIEKLFVYAYYLKGEEKCLHVVSPTFLFSFYVVNFFISY